MLAACVPRGRPRAAPHGVRCPRDAAPPRRKATEQPGFGQAACKPWRAFRARLGCRGHRSAPEPQELRTCARGGGMSVRARRAT
eukprot:1735743-Alexandrium_andersonii.AAC.1